jgi:hypothetical protein
MLHFSQKGIAALRCRLNVKQFTPNNQWITYYQQWISYTALPCNEWVTLHASGRPNLIGPWGGGGVQTFTPETVNPKRTHCTNGNFHAEKRSGGFGWVIAAVLSTAKHRVIVLPQRLQVCNKILTQTLYKQLGRTKANCKWRLRKGTGPDSTVLKPLAVYFLQDNGCWKPFVTVAHKPVRSFPVSLIIWCSKVSMPAGWRQGQISE